MQDNTFEIALFPLSAHVLPGGRLALRIFEPRYVRMVKEACAQGRQFGVCMLNPKGSKADNSHIFPIGTKVRVIDFDQLPDGLLGITVEGQECFVVKEITTEQDELRVGQCIHLRDWYSDLCLPNIAPLSDKLKEVFSHFPDLTSLYDNPSFEDPQWVVFRWLELLPVEAEYKQQLLANQDYGQMLEFLNQIME
ncbi:LON peptidase substrate-binding domain-containing protein [Aliiglaciecola sp. CAU 1673]|uniref:LON peptidase substrate-binding domain-containing protein n=1 Tax=Aliiglaciecola sp. CAU 1673 TaxID=3032595 RepID=UPI0023D9A13D|nr:LON peptidase substrate-binding domain-containing protein [Aliiglaciecola sp. CAU 1673]MDF2178205.1 LON peptidase substrate-binding domain-containing protein [Aliiglaciecola sp. CAU 1673]